MRTKNNKIDLIKIRCTPTEKKIIQQYANRCNLPISTFCREQALNKKLSISRVLDNEEKELLKMFSKYEFNFIRIGNMMKNFRPDLHAEIQALIQDMKMIIKEYFYDCKG